MHDVTLSFDNGPEPDVTPGVLDILAREQVPATFFVLGHKLEDRHRHALSARAVLEGHRVGNHTYTHNTPLGLLAGDDVPEQEIGRTQKLIGDLAGDEKLFRPFGGGGAIGSHLLSPATHGHLAANGYTCVLWNAVPRDWEDTETWPERAMAMMQQHAWPLVVLHDLPTGAMAHLERFIGMVRKAGGQFRQDFPPDCVPMRHGREVWPMEPYIAA